jgi:hypothetical protein
MTRDDIIRMARKAGYTGLNDPWLHTFAALVAAQEREACATACEEFYSIEWLAQHCAAAIRARGQA